MRQLVALFASNVAFLSILNVAGGTIAGAWLVVLGEWRAIGLGLAGVYLAQFVLGIALFPSTGFGIGAMWFAERRSRFGMLTLGLLANLYIAAVMTVWCVGILYMFTSIADSRSWIPMLIWAYGVATGPWAWMADQEAKGSGGREASILFVIFAQLGFVLMMITLAIRTVTLGSLTLMFAIVMLVGVAVQMSLACAVSKHEVGAKTSPEWPV